MAAYAGDEIFCALDETEHAPMGFRVNGEPRARIPLVDELGQRHDVDLVRGAWAGFSGFDIPDGYVVWYEGEYREFRLDRASSTGTSHGVHDGEIEAPMPGKVTAVEVKKGEKVEKGQRLLTLEAMKMEHALTAPFDGTVVELNARAGAQVTEGQMLVKVEPEPEGV